jgi:hypothetical protein
MPNLYLQVSCTHKHLLSTIIERQSTCHACSKKKILKVNTNIGRLPKIYLEVCVWTCFKKKNLLGSDEGRKKEGRKEGAKKKARRRRGAVHGRFHQPHLISSHQPMGLGLGLSHHRRIERQADAVAFGAPAALRRRGRGQPPRHSSLPVPRTTSLLLDFHLVMASRSSNQ